MYYCLQFRNNEETVEKAKTINLEQFLLTFWCIIIQFFFFFFSFNQAVTYWESTWLNNIATFVNYMTQCVYVCVCSVMSNSLDSMDYNPPGSSVHGILQARILEWVAISSSRDDTVYPVTKLFLNPLKEATGNRGSLSQD